MELIMFKGLPASLVLWPLADIVIRSFNALLWLLVINLAITIFLLAFQICFHSILFFYLVKAGTINLGSIDQTPDLILTLSLF